MVIYLIQIPATENGLASIVGNCALISPQPRRPLVNMQMSMRNRIRLIISMI